jgi:hypothetical protein
MNCCSAAVAGPLAPVSRAAVAKPRAAVVRAIFLIWYTSLLN